MYTTKICAYHDSVGGGIVPSQMGLELELLAAAGDVAAVRPVRQHAGHLVLLAVTARLLLAHRVKVALAETRGHLQPTVPFPVCPARLAQPALHVRRAPRVPLARHGH